MTYRFAQRRAALRCQRHTARTSVTSRRFSNTGRFTCAFRPMVIASSDPS